MGNDCLRSILGLILAAALAGCLEGKDGQDGSNGSDGQDATPVLMNTAPESSGPNCSNGGHRIDSGLDVNLNGFLDNPEIQTTAYVCNGEGGTHGSDGTNALVTTTSEPAGSNCPAGGYKIETGVDTNANSTLDPSEVQATSYICNGEDNSSSLMSLVEIQTEPAGTNCASGGQRIDYGIDLNGNGSLDADEKNTTYVCNGSDGSDGNDGLGALVNVTNEPAGDHCEAGGYLVESGQDSNDNGSLDPDEVLTTAYVCHGVTGYVFTPSNPLNDTGITLCGDVVNDVYSAVHQNNLDCASVGATATTDGVDGDGDTVPAGQDAHFGRDADSLAGSLIKVGAGQAGFDFSKLDVNGDELADGASSWTCVRDNVTGLIWEVKTASAGLHYRSNSYTWFNSSGVNDGDSAGTANGGTCSGGSGCDTEAFVSDVNAAGLCGAGDWHLPTPTELNSIVHNGRKVPAIDQNLFPNGFSSAYWTSAPYAADANYAWSVNFEYGFLYTNLKSYSNPVRLVRGGQ